MNEEKKSKEKEGDVVKDDIIQDYDSVLKESGVLTSVSGIIFGFLLNISINSPKGFTIEDSVILMISLYSISFAVSFFVMPIIYHHIQYPYRDIEKFKIRSHKFIKFGMVPGAITMYSQNYPIVNKMLQLQIETLQWVINKQKKENSL